MKELSYDRVTDWIRRSRWWLSSVAVLAASALLATTGHQLPWTDDPTDVDLGAVSWVALGLLFLLHLGRRRRPVLALTGTGAVVLGEAVLTGHSSLAVCVLAGDLLFQAVTDGRPDWLVSTSPAGSTLTLAAITVALLGGELDPRWASAGSLMAVIGVCLWWGRSVRQSREIAEQERELLARTALAEQLDALETERLRISRDLHDAVSGHLSAIALLSESALAADRAGTVRPDVLPAVRHSALDALAEMRSMIDLLRGDETLWAADRSLDDAVRAARATGATVVTELPTEIDDLPPAILRVVERGVREALSNATRHAPGAAIEVAVTIGPDRVRVTVTDHGSSRPPGPAARGAGLGLVALAERLAEVGGRSTAGPHGSGWRVEFDTPVSSGVPDRRTA